ncbi:MAG: helix-turn-helix domain-containing protein [Actinoallomurus sp.]
MERRESRPGTPDPRLRPLLDRDYVAFTETAVPLQRWLMPPAANVTMILSIGEPLGELSGSFVSGIGSGYSLVEYGGTWSCLDLKLTPLGAYTLLGVPMDELMDRMVDVGDVLGADGRRFADALAEAPTWERRFDLTDAFLLRRASAGPEPAGGVTEAWRRLLETGGRIPIGALAEEIGWSRKHLITRFRQQIGLPPKRLGRIVRFAGLLRDVEAAAGPVPWDRVAAEYGYYDQAHLNRDFREFTGTSPTGYLTRLVPGGGVRGDAVGDEVKSVQDAQVIAV